ncbi:MAG TPA: zf-HC2 domain-containing protein [Candidatus Dormibacteraeota bacterium]|nr:zf-HC2 domain-containing protein [Candidatus Dormibacteraeota bacterium]
MKCSLLTLSTYIDDELTPDRRAELDAHLVGCGRCSAGAATLREEKTRLGQLARVRVAPDSARLMLEQVGITGVTDLPAPARPAAPIVEALPEQQPWQVAQQRAQPSNAALPWRPRRPAPLSAAIDAATAPPSVPDVQPDLPFVSTPAEQRSWSTEPAPAPEPELPPILLPAATHAEPGAPPPPADVTGIDYPWIDADVPVVADASAAGWEMAPGDEAPHREHGPVAPAPLPPPPVTPPVRAPSGGGSMLWSRLRDSVAVRLTLARHADRVEDSIQIVSGATPPRGLRLPVAGAAAAPEVVAEPGDVELTGVGQAAPVDLPTEALVATSPEAAASAPPAVTPDDARDAADAEPAPWNAFGASSYPRGIDVEPPAPSAPIKPSPLGRHSRAVAREQVTVVTRMRRALAAMATMVRDRGETAAAGTRTAVRTTRGANPDRRIIAVVAAVAIVFITALVLSHRSTPTNNAVAGAGAATSATSHASASAAPTSAPAASAAPATSAPAATGAPVVQSFGGAGTGFQVRDIRYGQQATFMRMVFDMGPVSGSSGSSPKVTVGTTPTSVLVTLNGTLPAGSTGIPPARGVISSVTLVSSGGGKTVYRITVTHPVTVTGMFLSGTSPPLRFVLDLH